MRQLADLRDLTQTWRGLERQAIDLSELRDMLEQEAEASLEEELHSGILALQSALDKAEFELLLSDEYDRGNVLMAIHAGAGGTESQDWADMLLRMYLRWAERNSYKAEVVDTMPGEQAGIKSALLEIKGKYAFGYLKSEHGVHRLVRLSPFDADHARHTSFAMVEVLPEAAEAGEITIAPEDLKVEVFRSSGPGGQHMQKSSTAVRLTHVPTGIVVSSQNQRSQLQNKEAAMRVLRAHLLERQLREREAEKAKLKGEHLAAAWGNQIRSYVLHPYRLVKDHRTGWETSDTTSVLDGKLDEGIQAFLKWKVGERK